MEKLFEYYSEQECVDLHKNEEKLVYVDDGIDEVLIRVEDLADFIVDYNEKVGLTDLKIYDYPSVSMNPFATTKGMFLDKCDYDFRNIIIDRLVEVQQGAEIKQYKLIDEDIMDKVSQTAINTKEDDIEILRIAVELGCNILNDKIKNSNYCDSSYEICSNLAKMFIKSEEYKNEEHSTNENLIKWVENNSNIVNEQLGIEDNKKLTRQLDNAIVIDVGYRDKTPIALVKKENQYIIGFGYEIKDNNIEWAYGRYYDNNKEKAVEDFKRALSGEAIVLDKDDRDER